MTSNLLFVSNENRVRGNEFKLHEEWLRLEVAQNSLNMNNEIRMWFWEKIYELQLCSIWNNIDSKLSVWTAEAEVINHFF